MKHIVDLDQDSEPETDGDEINEPDFLENVLITIDTAVQKIIQSSYIAANITMMVSINLGQNPNRRL